MFSMLTTAPSLKMFLPVKHPDPDQISTMSPEGVLCRTFISTVQYLLLQRSIPQTVEDHLQVHVVPVHKRGSEADSTQ